MRTRIIAAAVGLGLALTGAGCGNDDPQDGDPKKPASSAAPAAGPEIAADTYSYNAPKGWDAPSQDPPGFDFDSLSAETSPGEDGFSDNINVLRIEPAPVDSTDELEDQSVKELESFGAKNLEVRERESIDGADAIHLSGGSSMNNISYVVEQFSTIRDGSVYVVTFSFSTNVPRADRVRLAESVLATWRWKA